MSKFPYLVIAVIVLLSLTACAGGPWTLSQSSDHINLRWWADEVADTQAAGTAGAYCSQMGKAAETIAIERDGSASIGHYRCIQAPSPRDRGEGRGEGRCRAPAAALTLPSLRDGPLPLPVKRGEGAKNRFRLPSTGAIVTIPS